MSNRLIVLLRKLLGLLLIVLVGWFSLRLYRSWVQEHEVLALRRVGNCEVFYDGKDVDYLGFLNPQNSLPPVTWIEAIFGKHLVHRAELVWLPADRVDEALVHIKRLPYLRKVEVHAMGDSIEVDPVEVNLEEGVSKIRDALPKVETRSVVWQTGVECQRLPRE
jgi:hypothetical protein